MSFDADHMWQLIPAFYRVRDAEVAAATRSPEAAQKLEESRQQLRAAQQFDPESIEAQRLHRKVARLEAGPLRALIELMAEQSAVLEEDLEQLYDDQFIETCAEWAVPYIGELVGARGLAEIPGEFLSRRAQVANTLAYRRRKGTAAVLEQLARDVTLWDSSVVEFFQLLITTQFMNHIRPGNQATMDLRGIDSEPPVDSPFGSGARTIDVRRAASRRGKFNIRNVGVFLWRVQSFPLTSSPAYRLDDGSDRHFTFHPLGWDSPLFNRPRSEEAISHLATPDNVPLPIRRRAFLDRPEHFYGDGEDAALVVSIDGVPLVPGRVSPAVDSVEEMVCVCDLSEWGTPSPQKLAIDPELGRLAFPDPQTGDVRVSFHYGYPAEIGGGEYPRSTTFLMADEVERAVDQGGQSLTQALAALGGSGAVEIVDSGRHAGNLAVIAGADGRLEVRAADEQRPHLALDGSLQIGGLEGAEVTLNGLLVSGGTVTVPATAPGGQPNGLSRLRLVHCTLVPPSMPPPAAAPASPPASPPTSIDPVDLVIAAPGVEVEIERSIVGRIRCVKGSRVEIRDSIVDAGDRTGVAFAALDGAGPGAALTAIGSTLIGRLHTARLDATDSLFATRRAAAGPWTAPVRAERLQEGCVRYSYVPNGSLVPRRYKCQPAAETPGVRPGFCSLQYGHPVYGLLTDETAKEIREGAEDGAEMGAFHHLYQPQREAALRARLKEYLRFGLEAGIFHGS